jgi:hypothetical protein
MLFVHAAFPIVVHQLLLSVLPLCETQPTTCLYLDSCRSIIPVLAALNVTTISVGMCVRGKGGGVFCMRHLVEQATTRRGVLCFPVGSSWSL